LNGVNGIEFTLGLKLDGISAYQDMANSQDSFIRSLSKILIYTDPKISKFKDEVLVGHFVTCK